MSVIKKTVVGYDWENWHISNSITSNGIFYARAFIKADDGTLVAGGYYGIVYSEDNGKTWQNTDCSSRILAFMKTSSGTLIGGHEYGIVYSEDNGKIWKSASDSTTGGFNAFIEADNGRLVAGNFSSDGIIQYSEDGGKNWKNSNITISGTSSHWVWGAFGKTANGTLVAGSSTYNNHGEGIYYSEDNGRSWKVSNINYYEFGAFILTNGRLIAGGKGGIKYSTDGKTWTDTNIKSGSGYFNTFVKTANGTLVAGGNGCGLIYSENNGESWSYSTSISKDVNSKPLIKLSDGSLILGSYGIQRSIDNGKTWEKIDSIPNHYFTSFIKADDGTIVAGASTNGDGISCLPLLNEYAITATDKSYLSGEGLQVLLDKAKELEARVAALEA